MNSVRFGILLAVCVPAVAAQDDPFAVVKTPPDLSGVQANAQKLPCILYNRETDYEGGIDDSNWECKVFGPDAQNAGAPGTAKHTMVDIVGFSNILAARDNVLSGVTTLLTKGAILANHTLTITKHDGIYFGSDIPSVNRRRRLSAKSGNLEVLVVRVTTNDGSLTKNSAGISDDIFGTNGDVVNFKSNAEDCSNNAVTITPGTGSGSVCVDEPNFTGAAFTVSGANVDCDWFTFFQLVEPGVWCPIFGDDPDTGGGPETANTACCACGGGNIVNYNNPVQNGVIDISLNVNAMGLNRFDLENRVEQELNTLFSVSDIGSRFDNIMMCVPKGTFRPSDNSVRWIAYAYVGGFISVYNGDDQCANPSTHLHEVGHNWGLRHASDNNDRFNIEYGDLSGVMGLSTGNWDDEPNGRYCFNGAHSWQLGWYSTDSLEIDPLTQTYIGGLAGVAKLPNGIANDEKIVLKLSNTTEDYYLMYNHAIGANIGTAEGENKVTLTSKTRAAQSRTFLEAILPANTHYTFNDYDGNGRNVTIVVTTIDESATGRANIEVFPGELSDRPEITKAPTSSPTWAPTGAPTSLPTSDPTSGPTSGPTLGPTKSPVTKPTTSEPTSMPTSAPTGGPTSLPTSGPTSGPTSKPTSGPTLGPTKSPVLEPTTSEPTSMPTSAPTGGPTSLPTSGPTSGPTSKPTSGPTSGPTLGPTKSPVAEPTTAEPTSKPTSAPTGGPTSIPTSGPTPGPTSIPSSGPTSGPTKATSADPTSQPTSGPTSKPTSGPTSAPTSKDVKQSASHGDPHFRTWTNDFFEFHGQCDLVMVSNKNFANGLGLHIHLRTKIVRFWSYIRKAVIRIGDDLLEVEGLSGETNVSYWFNFEYMGKLESVGGFPVSINPQLDKYVIDLGSLYPGQQIQIKAYKEFVGVKIVGATESSFGKSTGIIGDFHGNTYARDGKTVLDDYNDLGNEWQVIPSDEILFHDTSRPQFPEKCWVPEDPRGERRRRLDETSISEKEAEKACAGLDDEFDHKGCVYDILATQDLSMVGAY